jgi:hypothetical protein
VDAHPLSLPGLVDPGPHRIDDAGDLVTGDKWEAGLGRSPRPVVHVRPADPGGAHPHQHLSRAREGIRQFPLGQRLSRRGDLQNEHDGALLFGEPTPRPGRPPDGATSLPDVTRPPITDLLDHDRALTLRSSDGRPLLRIGLGPGLAAGAAALLLAPRATAVAAVAGMFRGLSLTVDRVLRSTREAA